MLFFFLLVAIGEKGLIYPECNADGSFYRSQCYFNKTCACVSADGERDNTKHYPQCWKVLNYKEKMHIRFMKIIFFLLGIYVCNE